MCNNYSARSDKVPAQCSVRRVNAIAGANRQRNQQTVCEMEQDESSTSVSDESLDEDLETELAESVPVQSTASGGISDAVCDVKTDNASVDVETVLPTTSQQQSSVENVGSKQAELATVRQAAVHIAVKRTAEIQVYCFIYQ